MALIVTVGLALLAGWVLAGLVCALCIAYPLARSAVREHRPHVSWLRYAFGLTVIVLINVVVCLVAWPWLLAREGV